MRPSRTLGGNPIFSPTIDVAILGPAIVLALTAGNVVPARAAPPPGAVDPVGVAVRRAPGEYGVFVALALDSPGPAGCDVHDEGADRCDGNSQERPEVGSHEKSLPLIKELMPP